MFRSALKFLIIAGIVVFVGYVFVVSREEIQLKNIPEVVVDFEALKTNGERTSFVKEKGRVTLIVLSASWCPSCIAEIPLLKKTHEKYAERGLKILMVSEDDNLKIAARFKNKYDFPWEVVHWNYELMNALGNPNVIPVLYVVDSENNITQIFTGITDARTLEIAIEKILD